MLHLKKTPILFPLVLLLFSSFNLFAQKLTVSNLNVEHQVSPLNIDTEYPRFSWSVISGIKNTMQSAYEIRVGTNQTSIKAGKDLVWKTRVKGDQSVLVQYNGTALKAKKKYYWQVRINDNHGNASPWSEPSFFQTGLKSTDWTAQWITVPGKDTSQASPLFRKEVSLKKEIKSAIAYITAKGLYEAQINGKRVSDHYFAPGWTSYKNHIQYQVYDVTAFLKKGNNVVGVTLANGWYKGRIGFDWQRNFYGDTRALLLQIEIEYTDGTKETVQTDDQWKSSYGPILASDIYDGETYDARLEKKAWASASYQPDQSWKGVSILNKGAERLVGMSGPPVVKHETFKALKILKTPKGETVVDFGQNLVGWVQLKARGTAGTRIKLSHAEALDKEGNFYTTNLRSAKQQNTYILKGAEEETFEPHFTFQGFRYVKVEGYPEELKVGDLIAIALYSDMKPTGTFSTSNALLNQLQHNIQWGQKGNFVDVPTDCPQRDERLGWTGDAQAFAATAAYNMDVAGFFTKWLKDVKSDQLPNGSVPFVVPNVIGEGSAGSAGWGDVATIVPWDMYVAYGDKGILENQYESMLKWVNYISSTAKGNLWNTGFHFGDWLFYRPDDDNDGRAAVTDKYMIAQTFYAHSTQMLINAARVLGKKDDEKKYQDLLADIKSAYVKEYLTPNGRLISGTQTAYVLALQFDMLPEHLRKNAAERLVQNIRDYGTHLTTGFLGTPYLCHVLTRFGFNNVAYDLLMQESYPSWLYPVKMGATTIWERWDGIKSNGNFQTADMNSFNHYAYGAIGDWMYKNITGIQPDPLNPGYKNFRIAPLPGANITQASASLITPYGQIESEWKIENGQFKLKVSVPCNSEATVLLPNATQKEIKERSISIKNNKEISAITTINNNIQLKLGSGTYYFEYSF